MSATVFCMWTCLNVDLYCFGFCLLSLSCSPLLFLMFLFSIRLCFWILLPSHPESLYKMADQVIYSAGFFTLTTKDRLLQIGCRAGYHRLAHWPRSFETSYGREADQPGWHQVPSLFHAWSLSVLSGVLPLTLASSSLQASLSPLFLSSHQTPSTLLVPSRLQAPLSPLAPSSSHTLSSSPRESASPQSFFLVLPAPRLLFSHWLG